MNQSFEEIYRGIKENEQEFLLDFMFELTILGRQIHLELDGELKDGAMKQLNELNHRILNRVRVIEQENPWCKREYLINKVSHHVSLAPQIENGVKAAALRASRRQSA